MADVEPASDDGPPDGWHLGRDSWSFHRQFYARIGRPTVYREYTQILWQIRRGKATALGRSFYLVTNADGTPIVVRGGHQDLSGVEAADFVPSPKPKPRVWQVLPAKRAKVPAPAAEPPAIQPAVVAAPPPPPPEPPAARPRGPMTLTLGNPAAARALAERKQRWGMAS